MGYASLRRLGMATAACMTTTNSLRMTVSTSVTTIGFAVFHHSVAQGNNPTHNAGRLFLRPLYES